jgi:L-2-hydroxyglutarate oxidase
VTAIREEAAGLAVETERGVVRARLLVNCAGLQCDRIARLAGADPQVRIIPFRGEYHDLRPAARALVRGLIYPVPDPRFPFLGVHLTRRVDGSVEAGPNAVLAWRREGYRKGSFAPRDAASTLAWPGFWRLAARHARTAVMEVRRSWSRARFARDLARLVPAITAADLTAGGSGVRAQAIDLRGNLVDDFHLVESPRAVHVLNAPSPGATASLAIGEEIAERALAKLGA